MVRWTGLSIVTLGFIVVAVAWGRVAGIAELHRQVPYVIGGGIGGAALVALGLIVLGTEARARDAALLDQRLEDVQRALAAISRTLEKPSS